MAFLDWPLSNGSLNPEGWMQDQDQLAEHSHRLLGMKLGLLSIGLVIWTQLRESRVGVRRLAWALLAMIIFQGLLGGLRVLLDIQNIEAQHNLIAQTFAVLHACGAQIVICLLVSLSIVCSKPWINRSAGLSRPVPHTIQHWGIIACVGIFLQILAGAVMRHAGAGLAIPTFPFVPEGGLIPTFWNFGIGVHFIHRVGAILVTGILLVFLSKLWSYAQTRQAFGWLAITVTLTLTLQIYLGALTIWTMKNPHAATYHMLVGAFLMAQTYALTFLTFRLSSKSTHQTKAAPLKATPSKVEAQ